MIQYPDDCQAHPPHVESFLAWLDSVSAELWRVLKPAGTLYLFCGPKLAADTELLLRSRFNVLNHIVWAKPSGPWNRTRKSELRSYFRATERIIMCEHYGAEGFAKGSSGYYEKCKALRQHVFAPLINYFQEEKARAGVTNKEINQATGLPLRSGSYPMPSNIKSCKLCLPERHWSGTMTRWKLSLWHCSDNTKVWHKSLIT
ncbi:DNA methyltransferase [Shewanella algae]|uniref:DNA methyltransferase n=1 Tax=Shewanella algae TaxID=38313 RepID=UPI003AADDBC9